MPYITDEETVLGIKEVVIFEISRHQSMDPGLERIFEQETSGAPTDGNFLYWLVRQCSMPDHGSFHQVFQEVQKLVFRQWVRKIPNDTCTQRRIQAILQRPQDAIDIQPYFTGYPFIDSMFQRIIQVGVRSVQDQVVFNGFPDDSLGRVSTGDSFDSIEDGRVMRDDQVTSFGNSLI